MTKLLKLTKLGHLPLCFAHRRRCREGLGDCLPVALMSQAQAGSMSGIIRLRAMTSGFAATANRTHDGTRAQIAKRGKGAEQIRTAGFQVRERVWHAASCWKYILLPELAAKQGES